MARAATDTPRPRFGPPERRAVVRVVLHGFHDFSAGNSGIENTVGHPVPFLNSVSQPELHRVHAQLLRQLVHNTLHSKRGRRLPGRPVALHLLGIGDDVVPVHLEILDLVGREAVLHTRAHWRPRKRACLVGEVVLGGGDSPRLVGPHLQPDVGCRSGACALEGLLAAHDHLDGQAALPGENGRHGIERVGVRALAPKSAAALHCDHLQHRLGNAEDGGGALANVKGALRGGPNSHVAVGIPLCRGCERLDVAGVDRLSRELTLHDDLRLSEAGLRVASPELRVACHVRFRIRDLPAIGAACYCCKAIVDKRGVVLESVLYCEDGRQHLVLHADQLGGLFGYVRTGCCDGCHRVATVEDLVASHEVLGHDPGAAELLRDEIYSRL